VTARSTRASSRAPARRRPEGAILACPCNIPFGATSGPLADFTERYKAKFNVDPAIYSTEGYDAATLFIDAIKGGNTTADAINTYISGAKLTGVSKEISFKPNGEPNSNSIFIYQVKSGALSLLGPVHRGDAELTQDSRTGGGHRAVPAPRSVMSSDAPRVRRLTSGDRNPQ
jgi:branched-chain amino acid transport system substrate-binding protein